MRQFLGECFVIFCLSMVLTLVLGTCARKANAGTYLGYGVGIGHSAENGATETKVLNLGYRDELFLGLTWQLEAGYWNDIAGGGRKSSAWFGPSIGVEVTAYPLTLRQMIGPSVITSKDSLLGGNYQFNNELFVGLYDKKGRSIGGKYKHFSSAGIFQPNVGRDLILVEVGIPW